MPGFFQEKSQISGPPTKSDDVPDQWVPWTGGLASPINHVRKSQDPVPSFLAENSADADFSQFNIMPPGMELDMQPSFERRPYPLSMAGNSDVSKDASPEAFREGFRRVDMKGTDDLYTGEHTDLWYGDVDGFIERNNYLDRS